MYAMGRHDFFPQNTSYAHAKHGTPHVALIVMAIVMFVVASVSYGFPVANGMAVLDEFNDAGTMGAFGFVGAYTLIVLAAPFFLKKRGELKAQHVLLCVVAMALMLIPIVGSVWPVPLTAGQLFSVCVRCLSLVRNSPSDGNAASETGTRGRSQRGSPETSCYRNRLIMTATKIGAVASLHRYPVKSMLGEELNATRIGMKGFHGDRAFAIADAETGKIASAKIRPSGRRSSAFAPRSPSR